MKTLKFLLLLLLVVSFLCAVAHSQEDEDDEKVEVTDQGDASGEDVENQEEKGSAADDADEEEEDEIEIPLILPSPYVKTFWTFTRTTEKAIYAGERAEVLLGFKNNADFRFNVTRIYASINHPQDVSYYIQNYTKAVVNTFVLPGQTTSFLYSFVPDAMLEPRQYFLILNVAYNAGGNTSFHNIFYNGTITVLERDAGFDTQTIFTYVAVISSFGLIGYLTMGSRLFGAQHKLLSSKSSSVEQSTKRGSKKSSSAIIDNEWLEGTAAEASPTRKGSRKGSKKI